MWKKPNPVKDKIFSMADSLRKQGISPTTLNIRAKIGGSQTTVSKYLRQWRDLYECEEDLSPKKMQKQLVEQAKINENLTLELLSSSTLVAAQRGEIAKLEARVLELETRLDEKVQAHELVVTHFTFVNKALQEAFDKTAAMLTEQLSAVNQQAIFKVQEVGNHFDEKIIENKLAMRELSEQLAMKDKELKKLKSLDTTGLLARAKSQ